MVWLPWLRPLNTPAVRVPVTPSLAELNVRSDADIAVRPPLARTASLKYSATASLVVAAVRLAVTLCAVSGAGGRRPLPAVPAPRASELNAAELVEPQLPTESRPWT